MSAGAARIVEVCFVIPWLEDNARSSMSGVISPFQHLPPFVRPCRIFLLRTNSCAPLQATRCSWVT